MAAEEHEAGNHNYRQFHGGVNRKLKLVNIPFTASLLPIKVKLGSPNPNDLLQISMGARSTG